MTGFESVLTITLVKLSSLALLNLHRLIKVIAKFKKKIIIIEAIIIIIRSIIVISFQLKILAIDSPKVPNTIREVIVNIELISFN